MTAWWRHSIFSRLPTRLQNSVQNSCNYKWPENKILSGSFFSSSFIAADGRFWNRWPTWRRFAEWRLRGRDPHHRHLRAAAEDWPPDELLETTTRMLTGGAGVPAPATSASPAPSVARRPGCPATGRVHNSEFPSRHHYNYVTTWLVGVRMIRDGSRGVGSGDLLSRGFDSSAKFDVSVSQCLSHIWQSVLRNLFGYEKVKIKRMRHCIPSFLRLLLPYTDTTTPPTPSCAQQKQRSHNSEQYLPMIITCLKKNPGNHLLQLAIKAAVIYCPDGFFFLVLPQGSCRGFFI